jgi:hypothetical protein
LRRQQAIKEIKLADRSCGILLSRFNSLLLGVIVPPKYSLILYRCGSGAKSISRVHLDTNMGLLYGKAHLPNRHGAAEFPQDI